MSNHFSIKGRLGGDVQLRYSQAGKAFGNGSIADTPRRLNKDTNQWEDAGATLWQRFVIFGADAERAAEELRKGQQVTLTGSLRANEWMDKDSGEKRTSTELAVQTWFHHVPKEQPQNPGQWGTPASAQPQGGGFGGDDTPPF